MKIIKISQPNNEIVFEEELLLQNGKVIAIVIVGEKSLTILEFTPVSGGQGNAERALKELKNDYGVPILVQDAGEAGSDSRRFWEHMKNKNLVDLFIDPETFEEF